MDHNWGAFKIEPRKDTKPAKVPMDVATGGVSANGSYGFTHPFEVAEGRLNGGSVLLGYLPTPDSEYVGIDLDNWVKKLDADGNNTTVPHYIRFGR